MTLRVPVSVLVCVVACAAASLSATQRLSPRSSFGDVLFEYQTGDARRAVDHLAAWDAERIEKEAVLPEGETGRVPRAAVALLLTEAGMRNSRFGNLRPEARQIMLGYWGLEKSFEVHSYRAYDLIEGLVDEAKRTGDDGVMLWVKSWYILTTSFGKEFQRRATEGLFQKGLHHADKDDPEVMLWRGSIREPSIIKRREMRFMWASVGHGQESRYWFRQAVKADPMQVEARMRLGRSLHLTQNDPDAAEVLEQALADALSINHVFAAHLAALTLGEIHEDNNRLHDAIPYYRQAVEIYRGHSASVALGMALVRTGQRAEGWAQGRLMFGTLHAPGNPNGSLLDPWVVVRSAQYWQNASRVAEMRKAVRLVAP